MARQSSTTRLDPLSKSHFRPLELAERASCWLFNIGALASFAPLLIDKTTQPRLYSAMLGFFALVVVSTFFLGNVTRLYFFPRAEDARRKEFLSNTFGFDLIHERTRGYYNNAESDPYKRMGMSVLENLFFTRAILRKMAPGVRAKAFIYLSIWLAVLIYRDTPLDWIASAAQVIFSEEVIARWLRVEWVRSRSERIYDSTYRLFQSHPTSNRIPAYAIDAFGDYETGKALGGLLLSEEIFNRLNSSLTKDWEVVKKGLAMPAP